VVQAEDIDVMAEQRRVEAGVSDVIQIQGLRKVYPASKGMKASTHVL
jgi:hypothetical protein